MNYKHDDIGLAKGKQYTQEEKSLFISMITPKLTLGYSLHKACEIVEIPYSTVVNWLKQDPILKRQFNEYKHYKNMKARQAELEAISPPKQDIIDLLLYSEQIKPIEYDAFVREADMAGIPKSKAHEVPLKTGEINLGQVALAERYRYKPNMKAIAEYLKNTDEDYNPKKRHEIFTGNVEAIELHIISSPDEINHEKESVDDEA